MTIQLSVVIWTVICFAALMLILHHLLFKPVLRVMDERRARIDAAARRRDEFVAKEAEYAQLAEAHQRECDEQRARLLREAVSAARIDAKETLETAKDERLSAVDRYRTQSEADEQVILSVLSERSGELAEAFAESVVKGLK